MRAYCNVSCALIQYFDAAWRDLGEAFVLPTPSWCPINIAEHNGAGDEAKT